MFDSVFFHLTVELLFGFIGLLIAVKVIGKRQVQQISQFDFVSAIVLGELLGNAIYASETTVFHVIYGLAVWTVLLLMVEKIVQKSRKARNLIEGTPKLVIKKGLVDYEVLKKEKLDFAELTSLLRGKEAFSIREIEYAILEANGVITVIKKAPFDNVKRIDLNITRPAVINLPLIIEGKVEKRNLFDAGLNEAWLMDALRQQGIQNIQDVLYAEWNQEEGLYVQKK